MTPRTEPIGFAIIQFLFWFAIVTFEAFMVPYLRGQGYTPAEIGPVMGAVFGLSVVGQPLLGAIIDRVASPRRLIAGTLVLGSLAVVSVPALVTWYPALLIIALLYSVTANSLPAVLDGWLMARREENSRINYGIARGLGSAGFAVGAVAIGLVAERVGTSVIFPIYLGLALLTAALVLRIPPIHRRQQRSPDKDHAPTGHVRAVVSNRPYVLLLVSSFCAFLGLRAGLTFLPILVEELSGAVSDVGFAHSVGALSEIPFLFLSGWIFLRWRGVSLIVALMALLSIRLYLYTVLTVPAQLFVLQASHGLTFGLFLAATVEYIHHISPYEHRGFFQALAPSVYFGLGSIAGSWVGGLVIERYSVSTMYKGASLAALLGTLVLLLGATLERRRIRRRTGKLLMSEDLDLG